MKSKRLYITMSIFIVIMVGGGTILGISFREDIQIRWYVLKLDSGDKAERNNAFEWLYEKAKKSPEDGRLKGFYRHDFSAKRLSDYYAGIPLWMEFPTGSFSGRKKEDAISFYDAVFVDDIVALKILLHNGVNPNSTVPIAEIFMENENESTIYTPLDLALQRKNREIINLLRTHGAMTGAELKEKTEKEKK